MQNQFLKPFPNRQWFYVKRPANRVTEEHFQLRESDLSPELAANEVIVQAKYISVDPYMRIQQHERNTYDVPHPLGIVQRAGTVGKIVASNSQKFSQGDWVLGYNGWQLFARCHESEIQKLDPEAAPVSTALGVLGMPGRTAWFGLMEAGRPRPGETVVVSGAAGAVGSLVAQFAKRAGCRVIGIAGGSAKCSFLIDKLKLDGAIDYKKFDNRETLSEEIVRQTNGVDIYFDNVGGTITDAIIPNIKLRARIIICGAISQYDGGLDQPEQGPRFLQHLLFQRATIQGILARDYTNRMEEMTKIVAPWVRNNEIVFEETVIDGFEKLPEALNSLFEGRNLGKLLVRV
ncbi:MAG: NADP-dependent oxidoreductase [Cyanobacteria bacterium SZAS LIN-5]|nr:NADP-dependent oxidoreductase [Cyanobacteria bacterium SZAS LIN-5]RTL44529.1 MAG: NADP-dependent oxidoreductase [Candidatus Melainabacteria bacterium]